MNEEIADIRVKVFVWSDYLAHYIDQRVELNKEIRRIRADIRKLEKRMKELGEEI